MAEFNRTALITGASRGLGKTIAQLLTQEGFYTLLAARDMDKLTELSDQLNESHPGDSVALPIDFHQPQTIRDLSHAIPKQWPPISVLINNAGVYYRNSLEETTLEEFQRQMEVNCQGPFILMKELVPEMAERGNGFVCNILATGAIRGSAYHSAFNASKFSLRALTQSLAKEYQHQGVHITGIVIDGQINSPRMKENNPDRNSETLLAPESIAREILHLFNQPRDAWTLETDLRPHTEFNRSR